MSFPSVLGAPGQVRTVTGDEPPRRAGVLARHAPWRVVRGFRGGPATAQSESTESRARAQSGRAAVAAAGTRNQIRAVMRSRFRASITCINTEFGTRQFARVPVMSYVTSSSYRNKTASACLRPQHDSLPAVTSEVRAVSEEPR